jgi:roadblock/LC7 domain-containing protein
MIPAKATCLTLEPLASNLIKCEILGIFSKEILNSNFNWDYIFFDFSKNIYYKIDGKKYVPSFEYFLKRGDYGVVVFENGWVLLKKSYKNNRNNEVLSYLKQIE